MDNREEKIDFFGLGVQYMESYFESLVEKRNEIKEKYGEDALYIFDLGIASASNGYDIYTYQDIDVEELRQKVDNATLDFSVDNLRNNSYFGGSGISNQTKNGVYSDPESYRNKK